MGADYFWSCSNDIKEGHNNGVFNAAKPGHSVAETWPVQIENTSIQYPVWFSNTEVSVSVFNLKNTE